MSTETNGALTWIKAYIDEHTPEEVADLFLELAEAVSEEVLEDVFYEQMHDDGYFDNRFAEEEDSDGEDPEPDCERSV